MDPTAPWRQWYQYERWRRKRRHQLEIEPFCRYCAAHGVASVAIVADHIEEHQGDWNKFWLGHLQSLCANCHNSSKRLGYDTTIGADGWPIDPQHPAHTGQI